MQQYRDHIAALMSTVDAASTPSDTRPAENCFGRPRADHEVRDCADMPWLAAQSGSC